MTRPFLHAAANLPLLALSAALAAAGPSYSQDISSRAYHLGIWLAQAGPRPANPRDDRGSGAEEEQPLYQEEVPAIQTCYDPVRQEDCSCMEFEISATGEQSPVGCVPQSFCTRNTRCP
jgi:hypothetical protein